mgnify:CR=1 FL=1
MPKIEYSIITFLTGFAINIACIGCIFNFQVFKLSFLSANKLNHTASSVVIQALAQFYFFLCQFC